MTTTEAGPGSRSVLWAGLATAVALAILLALGVWQLERKAWKEGILAAISARSYAEPTAPVPEAEWLTWRPETDEFRRVRLQGVFLHESEIALHGLAELKPRQATLGFYVFTPLQLADGSIVMINRGFVPTELRDPAVRTAGQVSGPVTVVGLVRAPEGRAAFVPANDAGRNEWFVRSLKDMASGRGLARVAPFYIDADATPNAGGWPRGGQTRLTLPNDHLQYAFTWFGLAATLVGVFAAFAWSRRRGPRSAEQLQA